MKKKHKQPRVFKLTDEQKRIIRERFATTRTDELAELLGLNYFKVLRAAHQMGLRKKDDFSEAMSAIAKEKHGKIYQRRVTDYKAGSIEAEERDKWMRQNWATTPDEQCAAWFGVNPRTIRRWAKSIGLKKDRETSWMRRIVAKVASPEEYFIRVAYTIEHYPNETLEQIAETLGISKWYVSKIVNKFGIKKQKVMEETKRKGKTPKQVAQLDPETLQVIKVWQSASEAKEELGATKIYKAVKLRIKSGGFYWCHPEDAEGFKPNPMKMGTQEEKPAKPKKQKSLTDYTDEELWHELERRGWEGNLTRRQSVTLGQR